MQACAGRGHGEAFSLLFPLRRRADQDHALAAVGHASTYMACEALGAAAKIDPENARPILSERLHALDSLARLDPGKRAGALAAFDLVATRVSLDRDAPLRESLILQALALDNPSLIQGLAKRSIGPDADGRLHVDPSHLLSHEEAPAWMTRGRDEESGDKFNEAAQKPLRVGLATALMAGPSESGEAPYALMAVEPLRKEAMGSELGRRLLACMATDKLLRRLSSLGEDQALIKDYAGRNPLHKWAALAKSKSDLEELVKLCPDWISQRCAEGRLPIDFMDSQRVAAMSPIFDKIAMRDGLGGKRGKKTAAGAKRKL